MGQIRIVVAGSFAPNEWKDFSAMEYGHADAVAKAIKWLADEVLPKAIRLDHELHDKNARPSKLFGSRKAYDDDDSEDVNETE